MNKRLTLEDLNRVRDKFRIQQPYNKPIVGIIVNTKAWEKIKEELYSNYAGVMLPCEICLYDKYGGENIYQTNNISAEETEVHFDKEILQARLKELKIA